MTTFLDEITLAAEEAMNRGLAGVKWAHQQIAILLGGPIAGDQCYRGENGSWLIRELDEEVGHHETGHAFMACLCRRDPGSIAIFGKSVSGVAGLNGTR